MLARYHEIVRYAQVAQAPGSGVDPRAVADVKTVHIESLVASIVSDPPPLAECTALLEELQKPSCMSESDIALLTRAINSHLVKTPASKGSNGKLQSHLTFFNYMTKDDWAVLIDERSPVDARMAVVVRRAMSIGLMYPSEQSVCSLLSIIAVAGRELWSAEVWMQHLKALKTALRSRRSIVEQMEGKVQHLLKKFPVDVKDFLLAHPLPDYEPIDPPVSTSLIDERRLTMAARKSHWSLRIHKPSAPETSLSPIADLFGQLLQKASDKDQQSDFSPRSDATAGSRVSSPAPLCRQPVLALPPPAIVGGEVDPFELPPVELAPLAPVAAAEGLVTAAMGSRKSLADEHQPAQSVTSAPTSTAAASPSSVGGTDLKRLCLDFDNIIAKRTMKRAADKAKGDNDCTDKPAVETSTIGPATKRLRAKKKQKEADVLRAIAPCLSLVAHPTAGGAGAVAAPVAPSPPVAHGGPEGATHEALSSTSLVGDSPSPSERPQMPELGPMKPLTYNGCKIYAMANGRRWRVYPHPQLSVYDKKFSWGKNPSKSWASLLDFCEHPRLPASRSGDIAHCS